MNKICKNCKHFDGRFIPPPDLDLPTYGICKRHGQTRYTCETDDCVFRWYRWRRLKCKLGRAQRSLVRHYRHFLYFIRRRIYYKVEKLWIRPKPCVVCGKRQGKYYYGAHKFPVEGQGKYITIDERSHTVRWVGKKVKISHWECEECFNRINRGEIVHPDETKVSYGIAGV